MIYQDEKITIFTTESLWYGNLKYNTLAGIMQYDGKYFVLEKSEGYGFFHPMVEMFTKGEIFDKFGIIYSMRDFFKKEVLARTYEIFGVNQLEKMEDDQITFLLDALENVSQLYDYIPQAEQKKIINKRLLTDRDFRNINARLIAGWFEMDGKIFFTQKHHKENQTDPNYKPLEGEERDKAIQTYLDALARVQLNFSGGEEQKGNGARMREQLDEAGVKFDPAKHKEETIKEGSSLDDFCQKKGDYQENEPIDGGTETKPENI